MLHEHDNTRGESGAAIARDSKELDDTVAASRNLLLGFEQGMDICSTIVRLISSLILDELTVQVTSSLDVAVTKTKKRSIRLIVSALGHQPTRRLGAEEYLAHDEQCWDTSLSHKGSVLGLRNKPQSTHTAQHKSPVEALDVVGVLDIEECKVHNVTDHNAECSPHLPKIGREE